MEEYRNHYLTANEVSKILKVTLRTLYNYRSNGELEYVQLNKKKILYRVGDVVDFLYKHSSPFLRRERANALIKKYIVKL